MSRTTQKIFLCSRQLSRDHRDPERAWSTRTTATARTNGTAKARLSVLLDVENVGKVGLASSYTVAIRYGSEDWNRKQCDGDDKDRPRAIEYNAAC